MRRAPHWREPLLIFIDDGATTTVLAPSGWRLSVQRLPAQCRRESSENGPRLTGSVRNQGPNRRRMDAPVRLQRGRNCRTVWLFTDADQARTHAQSSSGEAQTRALSGYRIFSPLRLRNGTGAQGR